MKAAGTFSLLTLLNLFELVNARPLPCFLSRQPSDLRFDTTPRTSASSVRRRRRGAHPAGNRYRLCLTPADVVPRESCRRSSGRATVQSTRHRRPGVHRYEPGLVTSFVDRAVSTRQPIVTSAPATCSGGVNVVLRCSAAPLAALVTFTFYVRLPLLFSLF